MKTGSADDNGAPTHDLEGLRILVVEDRGLIAAKIAQILHQAGCLVIGPAATLAAGLDLAQRAGGTLDAALLDIDLRGIAVYPLAEALQARSVPFLFLTGYGAMVLPEAWREVPSLQKPVDAACVHDAVRALVAHKPAPAIDQRRAAGEPLPVVRDSWEMIRRQRNLIMEGKIKIEASKTGIRTPGS